MRRFSGPSGFHIGQGTVADPIFYAPWVGNNGSCCLPCCRCRIVSFDIFIVIIAVIGGQRFEVCSVPVKLKRMAGT